MSLAFTISFEGLEEVLKKIDSSLDLKNFEDCTRNVALKADRMIKEATPKGLYGHYAKDGTFVLRSEGLKKGGQARKAWMMWRGADVYNLGNNVDYVKYIRYAWKRASDVIDDTFAAPKRLLTEAIRLMEGTLNDFYTLQVKEKFERLWS